MNRTTLDFLDLFDSYPSSDLQGWCIQVQYRNHSVILYEQNYSDFFWPVWQLSFRDLESWCIQVQYRNHSVILYEQNHPDFLGLFDSYPSETYTTDAFRYSTGIIV